MFFITEIFCHGQTRLCYTHTGSRWLVHLSEYQSSFLQYTGCFHLTPQVITFTGTFSYTGEDGISTVFCCDVTDQFLDQYGFTYTGTTEQTDLTTFGIGCQKVDYFDTCLQDLYNRALFLKGRGISVDYPVLFFLQAFSTIDGVTQYIEQTTQCLFSYRHLNTCACSCYFHITVKSFTGIQHNTTNHIVSDVLCYFHDTLFPTVVNFQSILDGRESLSFEKDVYYRSHDLYDFSCLHMDSLLLSYLSIYFCLYLCLFFCAFAPAITSVISWVIAACLARLY